MALLGDRLEAVARIREDAVAIVDGQRRMSYRELLLRADALARELEARGIGPRDLVGVAIPRSAELVVAVVGVVRAGAAYVPIDLNQPAARRALILSDARPKLVVTEGAQVDGIPPGIEVLRLPQYVPEGIERRRRPEARGSCVRNLHVGLDRAAQRGRCHPTQRGTAVHYSRASL